MGIASLETRLYRFPLEPPLRVAWDPVPRAFQDATVVIVRSDEGLEGYASGDALPDRALLERLLVGVDPLRTEVVREVCETVDFHHGRPWTVEAAVHDLAGRMLETPCWRLLGGRSERLLAYASSAELVSPEDRVARVLALRDAGIRAVKIRFHHADWREDVAVVEAVRDAAGRELEIMVDANQGWRMPGDLERRWTSRPPSSVRARSSRSACTGSRSRFAPTTSTAIARCVDEPIFDSPPARWSVRLTKPAT